MAPSERVPTGRAGRLWLVHRIAVAERGADHLERKIRILGVEISRHRLVADQRRAEWEEQSRQADRWALRAGLIGGHDSLRHAWSEPVDVRLAWTSTIGVRHPSTATVTTPGLPDGVPAGAAVMRARVAFASAVQSALDTAIAEVTCAALEDARLETRRRARILRRRWVPRLHARLHALDLALEQTEQEDHSRLRRIVT